MNNTRKNLQTPSAAVPKNNKPFFISTDWKKDIESLGQAEFLAVSLETTHPDPKVADSRILGLASEKHPEPILFDLQELPKECKTALAALLQGCSTKVAHNCLEIGALLYAMELPFEGPFFDLHLAAQLLKVGCKKEDPDLSRLAKCLPDQDPEELVRDFFWLGILPQSQLYRASRRTAVLLPLREKLQKFLQDRHMSEVVRLEFKSIPAVLEMTLNGIRIDTHRLARIQSQLKQQALEYQKRLFQWFPSEVDLERSAQIKKALATHGIVVKKTDRESLLALDDHKEMVEALLGYRQAVFREKSCISTYLESADLDTSRIYTHWEQLGTVSGMFSCSKPALQAVPNSTEIRSCFVPEEGNLFVIGNLSQVGLRIAAQLSGDRRMIEAFRENLDLYRLIASVVTEISLDSVTGEQCQAAKALYFGLLSGMDGAELQCYVRVNYGVALTLSEATKFRQNFLDGFPGIGRWIERQMKNQSGETRSLSGRRRLFLHGPVEAKDLICSPIQGTVADIQKKALGLLPTALLPYDAWIIACVRDEIIVEVDEKHARQVAGVLKSTLEQAGACFLTEVPTIAEVSVGSNWGEREVIITGAEDVLLDDSALHADRKSA